MTNTPDEHVNQIMEELRQEIDASLRKTPSAFVAYLLSSARLAALGDESRLRQWPKEAGKHGIDALAAIRETAQREHEAIERGDGNAICRAEDAHCVWIMEPRTTNLLGEASRALELWARAAEDAVPDGADALETIKERKASVPLEPEFRLGIVAEPLDEEELRLCAALPRKAPSRIAPAQKTSPEDASMAVLDGGHPTPRLINRFEARKGTIKLDTPGETLHAAAELDHWWGVRVILDGDAAANAESVRLGTLRLTQHPDDEGVFQVSLGEMTLATKLRLLALDICIRMRDGGRLLL